MSNGFSACHIHQMCSLYMSCVGNINTPSISFRHLILISRNSMYLFFTNVTSLYCCLLNSNCNLFGTWSIYYSFFIFWFFNFKKKLIFQVVKQCNLPNDIFMLGFDLKKGFRYSLIKDLWSLTSPCLSTIIFLKKITRVCHWNSFFKWALV